MPKRIAVLGASIGGLVAAAELRQQGFDVSLFEKGKAVGGLFKKTQTRFGMQELGMHVLYASDAHHDHLKRILGADSFQVLTGVHVDIGASHNFGKTSTNSLYPNLLGHPLRSQVVEEIVAAAPGSGADCAMTLLHQRFGETAATQVVGPILEKLWLRPATELSPGAIHCFYDLRRLVVSDKREADRLKDDPRLDDVIANPDQLQPKGEIYGGRKGLLIRNEAASSINERVCDWACREGVDLQFECGIDVTDGVIQVNGESLVDDFDAAILSLPMHSLARSRMAVADRLELSLYYLQVAGKIGDKCPAYYILCHDPDMLSARIVNYEAYNTDNATSDNSVVAVEVVHQPGSPPETDAIAQEVMAAIPGVEVIEATRLGRSVSVFPPTLANSEIFDDFRQGVEDSNPDLAIYFTGMRTDKGVFFSHHTIGLAYAAALDCAERFS